MISKATIEDLANVLKAAKSQSKSAILFLGAGASKSAGIPLAGELAKILVEHSTYGPMLRGLTDKNYVSCMTKLQPGFRKRFLKEYTEIAKLNQTHLYAAALVKAGYIDTIATVNFDQLMVKALSLVNIYPNVYDLAASKGIIPGGFETPTVAYLHGQSYGFWQFNTVAEMEYGIKNIKDFFTSQLANKVIIVLGYSGADPVFDVLSEIEKFEFGFYWVGYQNNAPNQNVQKLLESPNKGCHLIEGYNADTFMDNLKKELKVPEPDILSRPFSHVKESLQIIGDFELQGDLKVPWTKNVIEWVNAAIEVFEEGRGFGDILQATDQSIRVEKLIEKAKEILLSRIYGKVLEIEKDIEGSGNDDALMYLAFIYDNWGVTLLNAGITSQDPEQISIASEKFKRAIEIKPDLPEAYANLGSALGELALRSNDKENFNKAFKMYEKADALMPQSWRLQYNWGNLIARGALLTPNLEESMNAAIEKLKVAIQLNPNDWQTFGLLGNLYFKRARRKHSAKESLTEATKYYDKALELGGGNDKKILEGAAWAKAYYGITTENTTIVNKTVEQYKFAMKLDPKSDFLLANCGLALMFISEKTSNLNQCNEAISLFEKAFLVAPESKKPEVQGLLDQAQALRDRISR